MFQLGNHSLEWLFAHPFTNEEPDRLIPSSVQKRNFKLLRQFGEWCIQVDAKMFSQSFQLSAVETLHPLCGFPPRRDRAVCKRSSLVWNDQVRIKEGLGPQSLASRAGTRQAVERKMLRIEFRQQEVGPRITKIGGIW